MKTRPRVLPESLPDSVAEAVDFVTANVLGKRDVVGATLETALAALSEVYTGAVRGGRAPVHVSNTTHEAALAARARFFFLRDLPKVSLPLDELREVRALPKRPAWRVLDVGAGLGAMAFGVAHAAKRHNLCESLDVVAIDHDPRSMAWMSAFAQQIEKNEELRNEFVPTRVSVRSLNVATDPLQSLGEFDLIVCGFVLNELFENDDKARAVEQRVLLLQRLAATLAHDGTLLILEPALKHTSRNLQRVRDQISASNELNVFAPCLRKGPCPMLTSERDWCHESIPYALPERAALLARAAGLRYEGLSFSYLTLRRDGQRLRNTWSIPDGRMPFRTVSDPLPSKGKHELFGCGDAGRVRLTLLTRDETDANHAFVNSHRGDIFEIDTPAEVAAETYEIKKKIVAAEAVTLLRDAQDPLARSKDL